MRALLEIVSGMGRGGKTEIEANQAIRVGRQRPADLVVDDVMMSNVHFSLECGEVCKLRDLKSRFGTWVNKTKVAAEIVLRDGDEIIAGKTTFVVHLHAAQASAPAQPSAGMSAAAGPAGSAAAPMAPGVSTSLSAPQSHVLRLLRQEPEPLFALLDAARDPLVLALLVNGPVKYQTLYEGPKGEAMAEAGPFLVELPKDSVILETLVREGWGNSWGVYIASAAPFAELRRHFRRFLQVELPDGSEAYFRFYDPRVLRVFLPALSKEEGGHFFGVAHSFLMEDEKPGTLLKFRHESPGMSKVSVAVM